METVEQHGEKMSAFLFNSPLETGVRSVTILNACYPHAYDLSQLTWLDHLVVHSSDIGGPPSMHPDVPQRSGEILIRRQLIESGLNMMRRFHMVDVIANEQGVLYRASDEAEPFLGLMSTEYSSMLKERARWIASDIGGLNYEDMKGLIIDRIGKWDVEFDKKENLGTNNEL